MIKTFPWYSEALMIKMGEACMLCDITLSESDFDHMERFPMDKWTKKQLNHPADEAKQLEKIDAQAFDMDMIMQKFIKITKKELCAMQ